MSMSSRRIALVSLGLMALASAVQAVPVQSGGGNVITDRKGFIPNRKKMPLPGKIVGVLVFDAQPVLSLEGRSGPADQMCLGYNGASYRWVYVQVDKIPMIPWIDLPVGDKGEKKRFQSLSLASPTTVKQFGIESKYALVEIEVNEGLGSPADDSFVATKVKLLDGSKEYPLKIDQVIAELSRRYQDHLKEQGRELDVQMEKAATTAIKDKKSTGPRERSDLMFVTWLPESERLRVHFRSVVTDGAYKYENGINIDLGPPRTAVVGRPVPVPTPGRAPQQGLRYGTQFGIEFGMAYEVSKSGKVERVLTLPPEPFSREIKEPGIFPKTGAFPSTRKAIRPE